MSGHNLHDEEVERTTKSLFKNSGLSTIAKMPLD